VICSKIDVTLTRELNMVLNASLLYGDESKTKRPAADARRKTSPMETHQLDNFVLSASQPAVFSMQCAKLYDAPFSYLEQTLEHTCLT
jgi:hypothetical protein